MLITKDLHRDLHKQHVSMPTYLSSCCLTHTCGISQIPRPRRAVIKPRITKSRLGEEIPRVMRIDKSPVGIYDALPAIANTIYRFGATCSPVCIPFFLDEAPGTRQGGGGVDGKHVDALDGEEMRIEPGGVVAFVLECLSTDKLSWVLREPREFCVDEGGSGNSMVREMMDETKQRGHSRSRQLYLQ